MPWSAYWDRNYFVDFVPQLGTLIRSNYVRGAVSGLGLVNLWAALSEFADLIVRRHQEPSEGISIRHDG
jgi:hypothetical protein